MFDLEDFQQYPSLIPIIKKLEKVINKQNNSKIVKELNKLEELIKEKDLQIPISYILSLVVENYPDTLSEALLQKVVPFLENKNEKLRINTILIIGFFSLHDSEQGKKYFPLLFKFLNDSSEDVRINIHYFLGELVKKDIYNELLDEKTIINSLMSESNLENINALFSLLQKLTSLNFKNLLLVKKRLQELSPQFLKDNRLGNQTNFIPVINRFFPLLGKLDLNKLSSEELNKQLENYFLMSRIEFHLNEKEGRNFQEFYSEFKRTVIENDIIYNFFPYKERGITVFLQFEKNKLLEFFEENNKISQQELLDTFSIIQNTKELKSFIIRLIKLSFIKGYYSDLGYFYPHNFIKKELTATYYNDGMINFNDFNYLPKKYVMEIFKEILLEKKDKVLMGKDQDILYSLGRIQKQINSEAPKVSCIDLQDYRNKLTDSDFINLIKNLPQGYLTKYHKGTNWLTNLGKLKIEQEINNSKLIGFFDFPRAANKLGIQALLLLDIFDLIVDKRSGIYDKKGEIFYYTKYLNQKIQEIKFISLEEERKIRIKTLADDLNINEGQLTNQIDENLQLIGQEIKNRDQIKISEYLEKTGMDRSKFLDFIDGLEIKYLIKGDLLIISERKIKEAEAEIKDDIIKKSEILNSISFKDFDISSEYAKELIESLIKEQRLRGIFSKGEDEEIYFTERGIEKLMIENNFLFSFRDLFPGKELSDEEINILKDTMGRLQGKKLLKGNFNEQELSFSSNDILFANDYNSYLFQFQKLTNNYIQIFNREFEKIKGVLIKKDQTIFPQEIKKIQDIIDGMNEKVIRWRNNLDSFINNASKKLLKAQGMTLKRMRSFSSVEEKKEIKVFKEDADVRDLMDDFTLWVKIFNNIELKYANVIFYQKRLITNPGDKDLKEKYNALLDELYME